MRALIAALVPPGVACSVGPIGDRPPSAYAVEERAVNDAADCRRNEFRAGRDHARAALAALGVPARAVPRLPDRAPRWPPRCVGSISHSHLLCAAVAARADDLAAIGVDVEPLARLRPALAEAILTPSERGKARPDDRAGCSLALRSFSAKEAVFKAFHAATAQAVGFQDVDLDWQPGTSKFVATIGGNRQAAQGRWGIAADHVLAVAWIEHAGVRNGGAS